MTVVERVAARLHLTEGQLYSSTITLAVAALLAGGLGNIHGVASSSLEQPLLAPEVAAALPPMTVPTPAPAPGLPPAPAALPPLLSGTAPLPPVTPTSSYYYEEPAIQVQPSSSPTPSPTPEPCTAQPAADAGAGLIWTLDDAAGGGLPDGDLVAAIALVTGCTPHRPAPSASPSPSPSPTNLLQVR